MPGAHGQRARSPQTACQEPTDSVPGAPHAASSSQLAARQEPTGSVPGAHRQRARIPQADSVPGAHRQRARSSQAARQECTGSLLGAHRQRARNPLTAYQEPADSAPGAHRQRARSPQATRAVRSDAIRPNPMRSDPTSQYLWVDSCMPPGFFPFCCLPFSAPFGALPPLILGPWCLLEGPLR